VPAVRFVRVRRLGVLGLLLLLVALGMSAGAVASPVGLGAGAAAVGHGPCLNASSPSAFSGQLAVEGGPLAPSAVSQVNVSYSYLEQATVRYSPNGTLISTNCTRESVTTVTNASGGFAFSIVLPAESCAPVPPSGEACTTYSGPYVPVDVAPVSPSPPGYSLAVTRNGSVFTLTWVAQLARLSVTPTGPHATFSSDAPGTFVAIAEMANGTPSPLTPSFHWTLRGSGWRFVAAPVAGTATVEGTPGAVEGNLTVRASASVGATVLTTPVVRVSLEAVSTSIVNGSVNRTRVDAGGSVALTVEATGATGYSYSASVAPGVGQAPTDLACSTSPRSPPTVYVRCATSVTFPVEGSGSMSVNVSNGYSSEVWTSPTLTVDPAPALQVSPSPLTGYAGSPIPVVLTVANGSGTPPYATACFAPEVGPTLCSHSPGPSWTFAPTFAAAGNYSATAWTLDATGMNRSAAVVVHVLDPLEVGTLLLGSSNVSAGVAVALSSTVEGGVLPGHLWWNASDLTDPFRTGPVGADGPLSVEFVPPSVGVVRLSLTLIDALGTVAESSVVVSVTVGPVASVVLAQPPSAAPTVVGSPIPLAWEALDAVGVPVPSFAAAGTLSVETSGGGPVPAWSNSSAVGALSSFPEATFAVPSGAWVGGRLNLTVAPTVAGAITVGLTGPGFPQGPLTVPIVTAPDGSRLRLFDPTVVLAGDRTNSTYWHVSDRFGNPVPGAYLVVQYLAGGSSSDRLVPVEVSPNGTTGAWVNYSISDAGGEVRVLDRSGDLLLGPLHLAAGVATSARIPTSVLLSVATSVGVVGALTRGALARRASRLRTPDEEEEARRFAEGRGAVLEIVRTAGVATMRSVEEAWVPGRPPADLDDWVASLVADGSLLVRDPAGESAEFFLAPERPSDPRVTVDEAALDRAVARREAAFREGDEDRR
jgi:hypothetical protein